MYQYDAYDHKIVQQRIEEFRSQVDRRLSGELSEEEFRPLRLMNGVYLQLHAYMIRVAIPYGTFNAVQLRKLAYIARTYDKGYGHFTTRQNIQYNWPKLVDIPKILEELASIEMHAIQTSGNCIRNTTTDQLAGVAKDEVADPRPYAEIIRQWSTFHPEFAYLPRKFKIAITGAEHDRAAIRFHDIGLEVVKNDKDEIGFKVLVGGGLGRTPIIGTVIKEFLPEKHLLSYLEAILRAYNLDGRRDNKYKARIKILVKENGIDNYRETVEKEWQEILKENNTDLPDAAKELIFRHFEPPSYDFKTVPTQDFERFYNKNSDFAAWIDNNMHEHKVENYATVTISLKPNGGIPGDITADQMDALAKLSEIYSLGEIRSTHEQNLVFAHVYKDDLPALWLELKDIDLATPNHGLVSDIIACPGLDYCALANARSIPLAQEISTRYSDPVRAAKIGELKIKVSGCINACAHHHVGHIGILGVDKKGTEAYQILLGGSADENASIGKITGPGFSEEEIIFAVDTVIETYLGLKEGNERFIDTYNRVGMAPFKGALYD
ncbi:nitrite/sulfite reductase [Pseudemcibacter aquimaris]|uniref:nitrite/sulfite reductase n=1 Tax=Pseudemcibacter aquimaris TaxID=2857064 RepID=UPI00201191BE|nr:nitrite/sulfite reductase [Pseudemcibacter aquimaris]MCC3861196.1 nitrite/sulfite reductase [Pseudemcibacter aquimaris]WDU57971.1 nitrite/sulfite reductase [Pseudemcibacter aquimaris]